MSPAAKKTKARKKPEKRSQFEDWPVERVKLKDFKPADYNPRLMSENSAERLRQSLLGNGQLDTITVNRRTGRIVSGHQRAALLLENGIEEVWARVVDMDEASERVANVAANNRLAMGEFDDEKLAALFAEMPDIEPVDAATLDFDWSVSFSGFTDAEVGRLTKKADGDDKDREKNRADGESKGLFKIVIECRNEDHQAELLARFEEDGLPCQALIL
uniref:ParB-like N-terminal domain-containing protein n=2 Tax=viral metagenome TaxID=1070528 RepID=A0A6M3M5I7_9ZZZZ